MKEKDEFDRAIDLIDQAIVGQNAEDAYALWSDAIAARVRLGTSKNANARLYEWMRRSPLTKTKPNTRRNRCKTHHAMGGPLYVGGPLYDEDMMPRNGLGMEMSR
jgi:hypothetical protein